MGEIQTPMQGVRIWENPKNKFTVFELHYTADEDKRSPEWKEAARSGMPRRQFNQEYDLAWLSYDGIPVYGDWNKTVHGSPFKIEAQIGLPLLVGWDFGLCAAAIIGQLQGDQLCILKEFTSQNMGAERFSTFVVSQMRQLWPEWSNRRLDWHSFIDPSGTFRKDTDEGTCAKIIDAKGFRSIPGPVAWEARRNAVESFLVKMYKGKPCFAVNLLECPMLVRGFDGGYRYPQKAVDIEQTVLSPIKNMFSHIHDGLQYLCFGVNNLSQQHRRTSVPRPSYGFQKT